MQAEGQDQVTGSISHSHRWGLILAGGDGKRLLPLTRRIAGDDRPKQFCSALDNETLLHQTQRRVSRLVQPWRTLLVLTSQHEPFYADEVAGLPSSRLLIQPSNQGTAPAILYSLMRLREMDPKALVAFFPSDHHFSDDVSRVSRFWERPSGTLASQLMERGCLWNSFVMVGYVHAFLNLIGYALAGLLKAFEAIRRCLFTAHEKAAMRDLYAGIPSTNFSQDVLSIQANCLAVLRATGLGWSDLGEPGRVLTVLDRKGVQTEWGYTPGCGDEGMLVRRTAAG